MRVMDMCNEKLMEFILNYDLGIKWQLELDRLIDKNFNQILNIDKERGYKGIVLEIPRGHGKTTHFVIWRTLYQIFEGESQKVLIIVPTYWQRTVYKNIFFDIITNNIDLQADYDITTVTTSGQINITYRKNQKVNKAQIFIKTKFENIKGINADFIILDDIETKNDNKKEIMDWVKEQILKSSSEEPIRKILVVGSILYPKCFIEEIGEINGFTKYKVSAVKGNDNPLYPQRFSLFQLENIKKEDPEYFKYQMMNES
jgi:hypothetical protein